MVKQLTWKTWVLHQLFSSWGQGHTCLPHLQVSVCAFATGMLCVSFWKILPPNGTMCFLWFTYDDILPFSNDTLHPQTEWILYTKVVDKCHSLVLGNHTGATYCTFTVLLTDEPTDKSVETKFETDACQFPNSKVFLWAHCHLFIGWKTVFYYKHYFYYCDKSLGWFCS